MRPQILYCGDSDQADGAAKYLLSVLTRSHRPFKHLPPSKKLRLSLLSRSIRLLILSDFPASGISNSMAHQIESRIREGMGLLMIGGWASFGGIFGKYQHSPTSKLLPVRLKRGDDKVNWSRGLLVTKKRNHAALKGLPFGSPPVICGYNAVRPKPGSQVLMSAKPFVTNSGRPKLSKREVPLLVTRSFGKGRTAAFTTDCAPHWCGGFVDWGSGRVRVRLPGKIDVEYGTAYHRFWLQLFRYLMKA